MTVAVHLSPHGPTRLGTMASHPVLIADTMATFRGSSGPQVLPANILRHDVGITSSVKLVRKAYIFGARAAVAFSGSEKPIRDVFSEIVSHMPGWLDTDLPMDPLTTLVNEYSEIEIVGASLDPASGRANHIAPLNSWVDIGCLEKCAFVGSGRDALIRGAQEFDSGLAGDERISGGRGLRFAAHTSATVLANEIDGAVHPDWGGYLEYLYVEKALWARQPSTLHFFSKGERLWGDDATIALFDRVVAYDPGSPHGRILSIPAGGGAIEFILEDLMHPIGANLPPPDAFWEGWRPDQISLTALLPDDLQSRVFTEISATPDAETVYCDFEKQRLRVGLSQAKFDEFGAAAVRSWGRNYVSPF